MKALVLICAYLWLAATVYMTGTHEPGPPAIIAFVLGVMVTIAVGVSHDAQREILEKRYALFYGQPHLPAISRVRATGVRPVRCLATMC